MCLSSAAVNGLCAPSPSSAVEPALAAKAISVSDDCGSTRARPRPIERVALVRFMVLTNGLSRQASRMTRRSRRAGSSTFSDAIERHCLVLDVEVALQHGVDRQQVVGAVDLDAVAGVVDDRDVGVARGVGKIPHRAAHVAAGDVAVRFDHLEARAARNSAPSAAASFAGLGSGRTFA